MLISMLLALCCEDDNYSIMNNIAPTTELLIWLVSLSFLIYRMRIYFSGGSCSIRTDLTGSVVVITGAAQGIGRATMEDLLAQGCKVVFGDCH